MSTEERIAELERKTGPVALIGWITILLIIVHAIAAHSGSCAKRIDALEHYVASLHAESLEK